ncbi:adenosylcobinamide-GDP ribazoletransferase [Planctomycetota bacterium]
MNKIEDAKAALGFLTTIPVRTKADWDDRGKLKFFPLAGLCIGLGLWAVDGLAGQFFNAAGRGLIDIAFLMLITGGLHLDGLADSADGLFSHRKRGDILTIMKDSRTGVFGVLALIMVIAAKWVGLTSLAGDRSVYLIFAPVFARTAMLIAMGQPYARAEGGIASGMFERKRSPGELGPVLIPVAGVFIFSWRAGIVMNIIFAVVLVFWLRVCRRRIGGVTGDTLGALCELTEASLLFAGCFL